MKGDLMEHGSSFDKVQNAGYFIESSLSCQKLENDLTSNGENILADKLMAKLPDRLGLNFQYCLCLNR
jgi:hypothetical protein